MKHYSHSVWPVYVTKWLIILWWCAITKLITQSLTNSSTHTLFSLRLLAVVVLVEILVNWLCVRFVTSSYRPEVDRPIRSRDTWSRRPMAKNSDVIGNGCQDVHDDDYNHNDNHDNNDDYHNYHRCYYYTTTTTTTTGLRSTSHNCAPPNRKSAVMAFRVRPQRWTAAFSVLFTRFRCQECGVWAPRGSIERGGGVTLSTWCLGVRGTTARGSLAPTWLRGQAAQVPTTPSVGRLSILTAMTHWPAFWRQLPVAVSAFAIYQHEMKHVQFGAGKYKSCTGKYDTLTAVTGTSWPVPAIGIKNLCSVSLLLESQL